MSIHKKGFDGSLNRKKEVEVDERVSPAGEQCERLILDGTPLDLVLREEGGSPVPSFKARIEMLFSTLDLKLVTKERGRR